MITSLFVIEGNRAKPTPHVLLIEPFKTLWAKDTSDNKGTAIRIFTYIEFMVSPLGSNPFYQYKNKQERHAKIIHSLGLNETYRPGALTKQAIKQYEEWIYEASISFKFLGAVETSVLSVMKFLMTVDVAERDKNNKPVYKPADILKAGQEAKNTLKSLKEIQDNVIKELFESNKIQGDEEVIYFEE